MTNFASLVEILLLVRIFLVLMSVVGVTTTPGKCIMLPPTVSHFCSDLDFGGRRFTYIFP